MKRLIMMLAIASVAAVSQAQQSGRPDVSFIAIDDLNDWVGVLGGHPQTKTPNIDALAARGMLFVNAHTPGTSCNPARTAILTGFKPATTGTYNNGADWRTGLPATSSLVRAAKIFRYASPCGSRGAADHRERPRGRSRYCRITSEIWTATRTMVGSVRRVFGKTACKVTSRASVSADPHEWNNLAEDPSLEDVKQRLAAGKVGAGSATP